MIIKTGKPKVGFQVPRYFRFSPVRIIGVSRSNISCGIDHFTNRNEVISSVIKFVRTDLDPMGKIPLVHCSSGSIPFFTNLPAAPDEPFVTHDRTVLFFHDPNPPAKSVVGKFRAVDSLVYGDKAMNGIPFVSGGNRDA